MNVRRMCRIALMAAVLCIASPMVAPIGPVPISLATLAVYIAGVCLGAVEGTAAVALYILLGAVGLPVFSGFTGGFQKIVSVTGGYLVGYIPCVAVIGWASDRWRGWKLIPAMIVGTIALYALGTAWFMFQSGNSLAASLAACVVPFLPGDALKIVAAVAAGTPVRRQLDKVK